MVAADRLQGFALGAMMVSALAFGCRKSERSPVPKPEAPSAKAATASSASAEGAPSVAAHEPAHPPIDCPLHEAGVDPSHVRPFEDVEKYIAFLERPERATWQKPDEVVKALGLAGSETVVDIGSGSGYFAFRFAQALPHGKVIAEDTEPEMVRHVHHRVMTEGITNIRSVLVKPDQPEVGADADWVFICDVLHHVPEPPKWLGRVTAPMKSGARVALIEFKQGPLPQGPPESMKIPRAKLESLLSGAGLVLDREVRDLLPYQLFLVYRKP